MKQWVLDNERQSEPGTGLLSLLPFSLVVVLYAPVIQGLLWEWWDDPNYSHGFLIPVFSGLLIWQQREKLAQAKGQGSWVGLFVLLGGIAALLIGDLAAEYFLTRTSLILVLIGLVLLFWGTAVFRLLVFPLGFLLFMVPLPALLFNAVAFPLQGLAAQNAESILNVLRVPVLRDGNVIHLSHITLGVTEACSGVRSLISLLALAVAWGYLTLPGVKSIAVLVAATIPITVAANAARIVATGLIGQQFGVAYARGFFHSFSGWVIFLFAFAGLLAVHGVIRIFLLRRERSSS
jgi:exosortase